MTCCSKEIFKMFDEFFSNKLRMAQWLLFAAIFYGIAMYISMPQIQTLCWKLGNVTVAAFVGYWIDRRAFYKKRLTGESVPTEEIRRAIIIAAAMLAVSLGL